MLRTISGSAFSRQSVIAVWSMTLRSFSITSRKLISSNSVALGLALGIGRVHAFHAGRLDDDVRLDLNGAQHGRRVGGKVGIAGAGGKDHRPALFEVAHRAAPDVGLGELLHADGRHDARVDGLALEHVLDREGVDDGAEHAHVVGGDAVHARFREQRPADDVPAADHHAERCTRRHDGGHLVGDPADGVEVPAHTLLSGECFAGDLEQYSRIFKIGHAKGFDGWVV